MLRDRLCMGTLMVVLFAGGIGVDEWLRIGGLSALYPCWLGMSLLCVVGCCRELRQLLNRRGLRISRAVSYGGVVGVTVSNWVGSLAGSGAEHRFTWPFVALCIANMAVLIREAVVYREAGQAMATAAASGFLLFYIGMLGSFAIQLRWLNEGLLALAMHLTVAKCGDIGAYFGGRALGRHKLCPRLSPGKTVEGSAIGLIASTIASVMLLELWRTWFEPAGAVELSWLFGIGFGLVVGGLAQIGDLVESLMKRDSQQKDASELVPGFGGLLDVLDSVLFSAPLAFVIWVWAGPGWAV